MPGNIRPMDESLTRIIAQALAEAREKGLAMLAARQDMTASAALWQVNRLRRGKVI